MSLKDTVVGHASLIIEAMKSDRGREDGESTVEQEVWAKEQYMKVKIVLQTSDNSTVEQVKEKTHLILVVDKSGSMAGNPWTQCKESLNDIIGKSIAQASMKTDLVVYSDRAAQVEIAPLTYVETIDKLTAGGITNFKAAFQEVNALVTEQDCSISKTVVVFMTDGQDTANSRDLVTSLHKTANRTFTKLAKNVVIHAVGFTAGHDFKFLKQLAESGGTTPGMFRYCEPGDDRQALQMKLQELFDFIVYNSNNISVTLGILGEKNHFPEQGKTATVLGVVDESLDATEKLSSTVNRTDTITCEAWIYLDEPHVVPDIDVKVLMEVMLDGKRQNQEVTCVIDKVERNVIDAADDKAVWRMRILLRNVDSLVKRTLTAIAEKQDVSHLQEQIEKYQRQISRTKVFGNGITRNGRQKLFTVIKDIQTSLDQLQNMIAEYLRTDTTSISLLARAHDMRYQAVFSKSRRQRTMDKRVSKNIKANSQAQTDLASHTVDEQEVKQLSQDALDFYFCILSQNSIKDVLLGEDEGDSIGFGLAVKRSEVVLDEPTLIRIQVISGTLVSQSAMLDALEYKINISSHLKAHGGFSFDDVPLGVTTVGASREPINAWLPLYVTKSHWARVKAVLKPSLGSFCTLDPLGYHYKQFDVLFMVLGSMIGQLSDTNVGEHQLQLLFSLQRTCAACMVDFDLTQAAVEMVKTFVDSPAGRTKDVVANLYTVIGYIVSMPISSARDLFNMEDASNKLNGFWLSYISEWLRRAAGATYRQTGEAIINGTMDTILHGAVGQDTVDTTNLTKGEKIVGNVTSSLLSQCLDTSQGHNNVSAAPFDPSVGVVIPKLKLKHDGKLDRAMEIWAEKQTGFSKNLAKTKKFKTALKIVKTWMAEGQNILDFKEVGKSADLINAHQTINPDISDIHDDLASSGDDEVELETEREQNTDTCKIYKREQITDKKEVLEHEIENEEQKTDKEDQKMDKADEREQRTDKEEQKTDKEDEKVQRKDKADELKQKTNIEDDITDKGFDCQHVTASMVQFVADAHNKICQSAYPGLHSLPGCIAFVNNWVTSQHDIQEMDNNSGLAPAAWIQEVKKAVAEIYQIMADRCKEENEDEVNVDMDCDVAIPDAVVTDTQVLHSLTADTKQDSTVKNVACKERTCCKPDNGQSDYDNGDDDSDGNGYNDDDYSDDGAQQSVQATKEPKSKLKQRVCLPLLIYSLDHDIDILLILRAMLCQAVQYHSNSSARTAIDKNQLLDLAEGNTAAQRTLIMGHSFLDEHRENVVKYLRDEAIWQRANFCMLHASSVWAFVGYLMNIHQSRLEGFSNLIDLFMTTVASGYMPPFLEEKVHILLSGKYKDCAVLDNGNQWLPEKKMASKFKTLLGPEVWTNFEVELRSSVQIHVYRESDIPNRHGHCNSNPYIPNCLRAKLGMKLLKS